MSFWRKLFGGDRVEKPSSNQARLDAELKCWSIIEAVNAERNQRAVIRIRTERPDLDQIETYDTAISITWRYETPSGMPSPELNERQMHLDRALDDLSSDNGFSYLMEVATGLGKKEWVYYSSDRERFMEEFNRLLAGHEPYPIEIEFFDDPEWTIWREVRDAAAERGPS
jgi:hypothetical protein